MDKGLDRPLVALVGGDTLLAKEVREVLAAAQPAPRLKLISATAAAPLASAGPSLVPPGDDGEEEESALIPLSLESLEGARVAFLVGSPASSRRALKLVSAPDAPGGPLRAFEKAGPQDAAGDPSRAFEKAGPQDAAGDPSRVFQKSNPQDAVGDPLRTFEKSLTRLIDLTGALEEQPHARLRAPIAEPLPDPGALREPAAIQVIAHPAAIVLAKFLSTVARCSPVRSSQVHIFEPASERGRRGIEELRQQTVAVLNFQKLKTDVFDAQLAFNLLARYGEEALEPLEGVEQRLERHLASLLAGWPGVSMPSLRLVQVPVFHGHSFSVWVEFDANPGKKALVSALERGGFDVRPDDPPSNIGVAGESGISAGAISSDPNNSRAFWFWLVADNLRLAAENAVAVAQELL